MTKINMSEKEEHPVPNIPILQRLSTSISARLIVMGLLCIILLIPAWMVKSLIHERESRRNNAMHEISNKWGKKQTIGGPVLTVPFKSYTKDERGRTTFATFYAHFLPDDLSITGKIDTETRYRGIYDVVVYNSTLNLSGRFTMPDMKNLNISRENILWEDAFLSLGITDMKGIRERIRIKWSNSEVIADPGIKAQEVFKSGVSTVVVVNPEKEGYDFSLDLSINGSRELNFLPLGKETSVKINSDWNNPSFTGAFLPSTRQIGENGFDAEWNVLHLNRNYPQQWTGKQQNISTSSFGTTFLLPVDQYQKTMRTAKYALMFIVLTFLAFFMIEVLTKKAIHPIQYLMTGLALVLFYSMLLSISEHLSFNTAYLVASISTVILISAYTKGFLTESKFAVLIASVLSCLYSFLYVVLQLQDYSLLLGSLVLFAALSAAMYLTRKIDWYAVWKPNV